MQGFLQQQEVQHAHHHSDLRDLFEGNRSFACLTVCPLGFAATNQWSSWMPLAATMPFTPWHCPSLCLQSLHYQPAVQRPNGGTAGCHQLHPHFPQAPSIHRDCALPPPLHMIPHYHWLPILLPVLPTQLCSDQMMGQLDVPSKQPHVLSCLIHQSEAVTAPACLRAIRRVRERAAADVRFNRPLVHACSSK